MRRFCGLEGALGDVANLPSRFGHHPKLDGKSCRPLAFRSRSCCFEVSSHAFRTSNARQQRVIRNFKKSKEVKGNECEGFELILYDGRIA